MNKDNLCLLNSHCWTSWLSRGPCCLNWWQHSELWLETAPVHYAKLYYS